MTVPRLVPLNEERVIIGDGPVRIIGDLVSRFGLGRAKPVVAAGAGAQVVSPAPVFPTRVLSSFLAPLRKRTAPIVVDLGRAVGANVTFFWEQLGCKLFVDDVLSDLEAVSGEGVDEEDRNPALRMAHPDASVDGVLCWDVLDYLVPSAAKIVVGEVRRILRPKGIVFLCCGADQRSDGSQTTYEIVDEGRLRYRSRHGLRAKRLVFHSREMIKLFEPLLITDSVLLNNRMREMLFRKPPTEPGVD